MRLARLSAAFAVAVCIAATVPALAAKRVIVLEFVLTGGEKAAPQIKVREGETATITTNTSKVGVVPTVTDAGIVRVDVFDLLSTPHKQMGTMEVAVGGDPVQSETDPRFTLRVISVTSEQ